MQTSMPCSDPAESAVRPEPHNVFPLQRSSGKILSRATIRTSRAPRLRWRRRWLCTATPLIGNARSAADLAQDVDSTSSGTGAARSLIESPTSWSDNLCYISCRDGMRLSTHMKRRLPSLNALRVFEAAARHESVKIAAEEMNVTHAAVSRQIRKLEADIGLTLFDRQHRQVVLTRDGRDLLGSISPAFDQVENAVAMLKRKNRAARLVVSVDPDFAALWLVPRLGEFNRRTNGLAVEIVSGKAATCAFDCTIHYANAVARDFNGEALFRPRLFPVCATGLLHQDPPLRTPADLKHFNLIHDRSTEEWRYFLSNFPAATSVDYTSGLTFSDSSLCLDAAARGLGIAMGDDFLAATHLLEGRLVRPFGPSFPSNNTYYLRVAKKCSTDAAVQAFRNWLLDSVQRHRGIFTVAGDSTNLSTPRRLEGQVAG